MSDDEKNTREALLEEMRRLHNDAAKMASAGGAVRAAQQARSLANNYGALFDPLHTTVSPGPILKEWAQHHSIVIRNMNVTRIDNGLVMEIDCGDGFKKIYVESIDKLGEAVVTAVVAARVTK